MMLIELHSGILLRISLFVSIMYNPLVSADVLASIINTVIAIIAIAIYRHWKRVIVHTIVYS